MGGGLGASELFIDGPMGIVADEQIQAIAVDGQGEPMRGEHGAKECRIAMDVLGGPELQGQDLRGGVIDRAEQHKLWAPVLEPGEGAVDDATTEILALQF